MSGLLIGKHSHVVFYCRDCGHRSEVTRGMSTSNICPECRHYGFKFITFNANELKDVNRILRDAKAKPIEAAEVT